MMAGTSSLIAFLALSMVTRMALASFYIPYMTMDSCRENEYYDTSRLQCRLCGTTSGTKLTSQQQSRRNQGSSASAQLSPELGVTDREDPTRCVCRDGYFQDVTERLFKCKPCPNGTNWTSLNGFECATCDASLAASHLKSGEYCPPCDHLTAIIQEKMVNGRLIQYCKPCPPSYVPDPNMNQCVPCHASFMMSPTSASPVTDDSSANKTASCKCPHEGYAKSGVCLPKAELANEKQSMYKVYYEKDSSTVTSLHLSRHLLAAEYNCRHHLNVTACQALANMCVSNLYSHTEDRYSTSAPINPCSLYRRLLSSGVGRLNIWPEAGPWLYYGDDTRAELFKSNVPNLFGVKDKLELVVARFNAFGEFLDLSSVRDGELQLCQRQCHSSPADLSFGTSYRQKCDLPTEKLWTEAESKDVVYHDLYLANTSPTGARTLYPIPVLVKNMRVNGKLINDGYDSDEDDYRLVRRFFLVDGLTGIESDSEDSDDSVTVTSRPGTATRARVLRYAQSMHLKVMIRKRDGSGSVYPPLLTIKYAEITKEELDHLESVPINFEITYEMDTWKMKQDISISIGVLSGGATLWAMFRTWTWARRAGRLGIDPITLGKFFLIMCGLLANVFVLVNICAALNFFFIFKNQSVVHLVLPTPSQEYSLKLYLVIGLFLKLIEVLYYLFLNGSVDIFFVDWERPKKLAQTLPARSISATPTGASMGGGDQSNKDQESTGTNGRQQSAPGSRPKSSEEKTLLAEFPNVTIWRSYFVSNEWIQLCGSRRVSLGLHVLMVILFLRGFGLENLSSNDMHKELDESHRTHRNIPDSFTLRAAIGSFVYLALALLQILLKRFIYEQFIHDQLNQFVDLCSVSNVSVFCMIEKRYGYYIHGRSANGKADVNMKEMHELLMREENDLCSKRGLLPTTDQQTFIMSLPIAIYEQYHRLRSMLLNFSQGADRMLGSFAGGSSSGLIGSTLGLSSSGGGLIGGSGNLAKMDIEKVVPTYLMINKFLSQFLEHAFRDVDYTVKDRTTLETILDTEFNEPRDRGYFYNDNGTSFANVTFYGLEFTLLAFEVILFLVVDLILYDFTLSVIVVYLVAQLLRKFFVSLMRKNVVRKALIDERFLL